MYGVFYIGAGEPIISARISVAPISAVTKSASVPILAAVNAGKQ